MRAGSLRTTIGVLIAALCWSIAAMRSAEQYAANEWTAPAGDWASTRYSSLTQINTKNIKQLGGAWVVDVPERAEATPMVKNGRMFVVTQGGRIMALDPATG